MLMHSIACHGSRFISLENRIQSFEECTLQQRLNEMYIPNRGGLNYNQYETFKNEYINPFKRLYSHRQQLLIDTNYFCSLTNNLNAFSVIAIGMSTKSFDVIGICDEIATLSQFMTFIGDEYEMQQHRKKCYLNLEKAYEKYNMAINNLNLSLYNQKQLPFLFNLLVGSFFTFEADLLKLDLTTLKDIPFTIKSVEYISLYTRLQSMGIDYSNYANIKVSLASILYFKHHPSTKPIVQAKYAEFYCGCSQYYNSLYMLSTASTIATIDDISSIIATNAMHPSFPGSLSSIQQAYTTCYTNYQHSKSLLDTANINFTIFDKELLTSCQLQ